MTQATGYPIGRPRTGEIRPVNRITLSKAKYAKKIRKEMGEEAFKLKAAIYTQVWNLANPGKAKANMQRAVARRKLIKEAKGLITVG